MLTLTAGTGWEVVYLFEGSALKWTDTQQLLLSSSIAKEQVFTGSEYVSLQKFC
jgi:hypothetical protein